MKKKVFSFLMIFAFIFAAGFIGIGKVDAAWPKTLTAYKSGSGNGISYFAVKQSGYSYAFCMQKGSAGPNKSGYKVTYKQSITTGPRAYIINSGESRSVKAKAIWIYNHSVSSALSKAWPTSGSEYKKAKALYDAAKKAGSSYTPVPSVSITPKTSAMSISGSNFVSKTYNVKTNNLKSWSVSCDNGATCTKSGSTFTVKIPVSKVSKATTITIKVTGAKTTYYSGAWYSKGSSTKKGNGDEQDMLVTKPITVTPTATVTATIATPKCEIVGSTYYGTAGTSVSKEEFTKQCGTPCTKDSRTGLYMDKNKDIVSSEKEMNKSCYSCSVPKDDGTLFDNDGNSYGKTVTAKWLAACHPCGTYDGKFIGPNGEELASKEEQNAKCIGTCKAQDGKYYDKNGKQVANEKEMNKSCYSCEKPREDGTLFDNDGNAVTEEQHKERCNPKCGPDEKGKYYDANHNQVTYEEYRHSCFPQTPIPTPIKSVDTELIRYEKNFHYTIKHEVPYRTSVDYFKSYVFTDVLEEPLQITSAANVKIIQLDKATNKEEDWTNKFDIKVDGQKITASLKEKNLNNKDFYGTIDTEGKEVSKEYSYVLTVSLKDQAETKYDMKKYQVGDAYKIPDTANISVIDQTGKTNSLDTNKVEVEYWPNPNPIKSVSDKEQTISYEQGTKYSYAINYQVYDYKGNQRYKSFVLKDTFEDPIQLGSENSVVVKNEMGVDVTQWFNIKIKGQTLTATLKDEYNNDGFYGHTYAFTVSVNLKSNYNLKKYRKDNSYVIPNYATVTLDGNKTNKTNVVDVIVNLKAVPKIITPNTASPLQIAVIAAGIAIIISGVYAVLEKYNLIPKKDEVSATNKAVTKPTTKEKPAPKKTTSKTPSKSKAKK